MLSLLNSAAEGLEQNISLEGSAEESKQDERLKPIDRASLEKGFQDRQFELNEKKSLEVLKTAVKFFGQLVDDKRKEVKEMEK